MKTFNRFLKDESGATAIEYGLLAALISVTLIAGANIAGPAISNVFNKVGNKMSSADSSIT